MRDVILVSDIVEVRLVAPESHRDQFQGLILTSLMKPILKSEVIPGHDECSLVIPWS